LTARAAGLRPKVASPAHNAADLSTIGLDAADAAALAKETADFKTIIPAPPSA
jgi:hypothetical protein